MPAFGGVTPCDRKLIATNCKKSCGKCDETTTEPEESTTVTEKTTTEEEKSTTIAQNTTPFPGNCSIILWNGLGSIGVKRFKLFL